MVQAWIEVDPAVDVVELVMAADDRLRSMCVFDALVNNADRKGSHLLPLVTGEMRASTTASASPSNPSYAPSCGRGGASCSHLPNWLR